MPSKTAQTAHDEPEQTLEPDDEPSTNQESADSEQEVEAVEAVLKKANCTGDDPSTLYYASEVNDGDMVVSIGRSRYPMSEQANGWQIPAAMRRNALALLWRVLRSNTAVHLTKIRAVEALVKIDAQSLAVDRQDDWKAVQVSHSNRSNVRVLAELARTKAKLPGPPRKPPKPKG